MNTLAMNTLIDTRTRSARLRSTLRAGFMSALMLAAGSAAHAQIAQRFQHEGQINYVYGVSTMRTGSNASNPCSIATSTSIAISGIPAGATVVGAYLYWAGSGSPDGTVTFAGQSTSGTTSTGSYSLGATTFNFFGGRANVTSRVTGNGTFTLSGLTVATTGSYCSSEAVVKGWSLLVVYRHTSQPLRRVEVWDGLHVIRNTGGASTISGFLAAPAQDSRFSALVWEGDATISGGESLTFNGTSLDASGDVFNSSTGHGVDLKTYNVSALVSSGDRSADFAYLTDNDLMVLQTLVTSLSVVTVDVTPKGAPPVSRQPGTAYSAAFAVENTSLASDNFNLRATRSGSPVFLQFDSITGPGIIGGTAGDSVRATVPAQSTRTYQVWYTVPAGAAATNTLSLTARSVTYPGVSAATSTGFIAVTRTVVPDLTVEKRAPASFSQGANGTYTIVVRNVGSQASSGAITVFDGLPAGLSYSSAAAVRGAWSFAVAGQAVTATSAGVLPAGDSASFTITAGITPAAVPSVTNVATVSGGGQTNLANDTARVTTPVSGLTDLTITQLASAPFTYGASNETYTLRARNSGTSASTGTITITDTLPAGVTYLSRTGTNWTVSWNAATRVLTATSNTIVPAATNAQDLVITLNIGAAAYPSVANVARVSGGGDTDPGNNSSMLTTAVSAADVAIVKTSSASFAVGANGTYTIQMTNAGSAPTAGTIAVRDTLPAGVTFVAFAGTGWSIGTGGVTPDGRTWGDLLYTGVLAAGAQATATITVTVALSAAPAVTNTAYASGGNDVDPANNISSVTTPVDAPDLALAKNGPPLFTRGQNGVHRITVTNIGAVASTGTVTVYDTLPAGLTWVSAASVRQVWSFAHVAGVVTATLNSPVAAGDSAIFTITTSVAAGAPVSITNRAHLTNASQYGADNDSASVTTPVATADLSVTLAAGATFQTGVDGTYTISAINGGTGATAGGFTVTDTLPAGLSYVSASGAGWTFTNVGQVVAATYAGPALAPGGTSSFTLDVSVGPAAMPSVINRVWISGAGEVNTTNNGSGDVSTSVGGSPDINVFTTVSPGGTVMPGQVLQYEVVFTNGGAAPAVDVVATDDLPADVQFEIGSVTSNLPAGVTATLEFFDGGAWSYTPVSGGCGAPAGFDGCVTGIRWSLQSPLPSGASGTGWFRARLK